MVSAHNNVFLLSFIDSLALLADGSWEKSSSGYGSFNLTSFAFGKLPLDTLVNEEIVQKQLVVNSVKTLLEQSRPNPVTSRDCFFCLPDKACFSKLIKLPQVKKEEIKETIIFKIKDFLPHRLEEMYLDWKLIPDGKNNFQAGIVAVRKSVIDSYLEVCQQLNIYPLGFLPESYSLASLALISSPKVSLVVYFNTQKVIFCFVEQGVVLLTTSFPFSSQLQQQTIIEEFKKAVHFWQDSFSDNQNINSVFIGGMIREDLLLKQTIKNDFGIQPVKLPLPVIIPPNLSSARVSQLIPLFGTAFFRKQNQEMDQTISLIPEEVQGMRKEAVFFKRLKNLMLVFTVFIFGFLSLFLFFFLSVFFKIESTEASLKGWENLVFTDKQAGLEKQAVDFNEKLFSLGDVLKQEQKISPFLNQFPKKIPSGITITQIEINFQEKTAEIKGQANAREQILKLEENFEQFGKVSVPLRSFEKSEQADFITEIDLKKDLF